MYGGKDVVTEGNVPLVHNGRSEVGIREIIDEEVPPLCCVDVIVVVAIILIVLIVLIVVIVVVISVNVTDYLDTIRVCKLVSLVCKQTFVCKSMPRICKHSQGLQKKSIFL